MLLGLSRYRCSLEYFHQLIGVRPINKTMNFAQINGKMQEPIIANYFRYFEKDHDTMVKNINEGRVIREVEEVNGYMYDTELDNMFCSLDRKFKDENYGNQYCALEIKNESYASFSMWADRNPNQVLQLAYQLIISKFPMGVLLSKVGDSKLMADTMTYNDALKMKSLIVSTVSDFWGKVEQGRIIMSQIYDAKSNYNMKLALDLQQEIFKLEPQPQLNDAYFSYLSKLSKERTEIIPMAGTEYLLLKAKALGKLAEKRKKIITQETEIKAELARVMRENSKTQIDFGKLGSVDFFEGKFRLKLK